MAYEQIEISFDQQLALQLRGRDFAAPLKEEDIEQENGKEEYSLAAPPPHVALPPNGRKFAQYGRETQTSDHPEQHTHPTSEFRRGIAPFAIDGEIKLDYTFERFNANSEYFEERTSLRHPLKSILLGAGQLRHIGQREAVFTHKGDGSRITVCKNKIICDNTDRNIQSALDIAQDKGWQVIKITGGSKKAKAEIWFQAQMRGLETTGYSPTEADRKRLLGAQERQQTEQAAQEAREAEKLTEALDIKPKADLQQEAGDKTVDTATGANHESSRQEQAANAPTENAGRPNDNAPERVSPLAKEQPAEPNQTIPEKADQKDKTQEGSTVGHTLSRDQHFEYARKQIMAEVEKIRPLNEQQYHELEVMVDKQLAIVAASGKTLNVDKAKEAIRSGLPVVRHELESAGHTERSKAQQEKTRSTNRETSGKKPTRERQATLER